jgi:hypothetical protein
MIINYRIGFYSFITREKKDFAAPAIVSAVPNATGDWLHDLPLTKEKVLNALKLHK